MTQSLKRSRRNKVIGGVCGGLGDYLDVDPVIIRVAVAIVALSTLYGALAYIVAMIVIPKEEAGPFVDPNDITEKRKYASNNRYLPGMILIVIGVIMMAAQFGFLLNWSMFFAISLITIGLFLIYRYFWKNKIDQNSDPSVNNSNAENGGRSL